MDIIIGAGIGGLTLALMLHALGIRPRLYEAANEVRPLGVGINVQPSAVVELKSVGMLERLREIAIETAAVGYYNRFGQAVWTEPRGLAAGYHVPQFSIHRGDLQMTLHAEVIERLGAGALRTGVEAVGVNADDGMVMLRRRATGEEFTDQAEGVVAADGIHSAIRRQFYPDEGPPRFPATSCGAPHRWANPSSMAAP